MRYLEYMSFILTGSVGNIVLNITLSDQCIDFEGEDNSFNHVTLCSFLYGTFYMLIISYKAFCQFSIKSFNGLLTWPQTTHILSLPGFIQNVCCVDRQNAMPTVPKTQLSWQK